MSSKTLPLRDKLNRLLKESEVHPDYHVAKNGLFYKDELLTKSFFSLNYYLQCVKTKRFFANLEFICAGGTICNQTFPKEEILTGAFIRNLASLGMEVTPKGEHHLKKLLSIIEPLNKKVRMLITTPGWNTLPNSELAYAYGNQCITKEQEIEENIIVELPPSMSKNSLSGSLDEWKREIATLTKNSFLLESALGFSFASPLLRIAQANGFGVVYTGQSSRGKTLGLQIAASVYGNGSESTDESRITRLRATGNSLEVLLESFNDSVATFDELGQFKDSLSDLSYMLHNGQGKYRRQKRKALQQDSSWSSIFLGSGEVKVSDLMNSEGDLRSGMVVRFFDLSIKESTIEELHGHSSARHLADSLKTACGTYFGTAGLEFIKQLFTYENLKNTITEIHDYYKMLVVHTTKISSPEKIRLLGNVVWAVVGLDFAAEANIVDYCFDENTSSYPEIEEIAIKLAKRALESTNFQSDSKRGVLKLRNFISTEISRFKLEEGCKYGFSKRSQKGVNLICIHESQLQKITGTSSVEGVIKILEDKKILHKNNKPRAISRFQHRSKAKHYVYALRETIIELDDQLEFNNNHKLNSGTKR